MEDAPSSIRRTWWTPASVRSRGRDSSPPWRSWNSPNAGADALNGTRRVPAAAWPLDGFDFAAVPTLSKARVIALAAGGTWLEKGTNLICFGPPGAGKSHLGAAIGRALVPPRRALSETRYRELTDTAFAQ